MPLKTFTRFRFFLSSLHILAWAVPCVALCSLAAGLHNQEDDCKYMRSSKDAYCLTFILNLLSRVFIQSENRVMQLFTLALGQTRARANTLLVCVKRTLDRVLQPFFPLYLIQTTLSKPFPPQMRLRTVHTRACACLIKRISCMYRSTYFCSDLCHKCKCNYE